YCAKAGMARNRFTLELLARDPRHHLRSCPPYSHISEAALTKLMRPPNRRRLVCLTRLCRARRVLFASRLLPHAVRRRGDGNPGRLGRVLPPARHRLRDDHHGGAPTRPILAVRAAGNDRIPGGLGRHVLDWLDDRRKGTTALRA